MRILHLTTFLQGGAGLIIAELAVAQQASGHEVVVVTSATPEPGYCNYPSHLGVLERAGVTVHAVDSSFKRDLADNINVAAFVQQRYGGAGGFEIIHAHAAVPSLIAMVLASRAATRVPILQTMHGWGIAKTPKQQQADVAILNLIDRVIVTAQTSATLLDSLGVDQRHVNVIACGVAAMQGPSRPTGEIAAEIRAWQAGGGEVVCCAGTIGQRKNQRQLVEALPLLERADRVLCVLVGEGDRTALQELAAATGVAERVRFCGYREDARQIVAASDYFVLPSLGEGQPLTILQAFCDGVPVAVSAIPELRELVSEGVTGFLFDPQNAADLARVLSAARRLTPEARREVCAAARAMYESRFTVERMCDNYMAEYNQLRAGRSRQRMLDSRLTRTR